MRILFALHQFYPEFSGGTERVALNLALAAQRAGHRAHVIAGAISPGACVGTPSAVLEGAMETTHLGVPITLIPRRLLPDAADYSFEPDEDLTGQLTAWLHGNRHDLVHVLHSMRMASLILAAQRSAIPYLLTLTDFFYTCFLINRVNLDNRLCPGSNAGRRCATDCLLAPWTPDGLERRYRQAHGLLASAGMRVCPSEYVARHYREEFPNLEFKVIPHGIDFLNFLPHAHHVASPGHSPELTLGFVGTIVPQKGLDVLLKAFAQVDNPSPRLLVAGGMHGDTHYCNGIRRLASADKRVSLLGRIEPAHVADLMRRIHVLCLPSRVPETYSLALHEAAVAGVPALVSALGAPGEHVSQHGGGRCLPPDDIDAWSGAIAAMLEESQTIQDWRSKVALPLRVEEEAFFYESLYRQIRLDVGEAT
jgi:glycosyltransferase involved in cell wall biosynthesis